MQKKTTKTNQIEDTQANTIKVGTFQLQTKSFWMGLVAILCLFMLSVIWVNSYFMYKILNVSIESNKQVIELINKGVKQ